MSVDLEWAKLDSSLATRLVDILNRQLSNTKRPSFIGPVAVTSLEFGSVSPDVELVDLCDIYRDFLEEDEDEENDDKEPVKVTENGVGLDGEHDDGYEWVSRRVVNRDETRAYQHLPPHIRYGYGRGGTADLFSSVPSLHPSSNAMGPPPEYWNPAMSVPSLNVPHNPYYRTPSPGTPFSATAIKQHDAQMNVEEPPWSSRVPRAASLPLPSYPNGPGSDNLSSGPAVSTIPPGLQTTPSLLPSHLSQTHPLEPDPTAPPPPALHPNLQMHFHINWHSDLRITLTTSLLINYPSTMFMSLPIKLSVTGLLFTGEVVVAYEGERKRVHLCILDDLDPYGPAGERPKRDSLTGGTTPPELDDEHHANGNGNLSAGGRPSKPLPVGHRLLPSIYIESEIGQADKHVLKNVGRVEKFIQDVIRKTVEEELVFPNFHTLILGEQ